MRIVKSTEQERNEVEEALDAFNKKNEPAMSEMMDHSFVMKDDEGNILAGINAMIYWQKVMFIDILVVGENLRGRGYGTKLLKFTEEKAIKSGVCLSHLETSDWQAKGFYEKMGYQVFGALDLPLGHKVFYLKKTLT